MIRFRASIRKAKVTSDDAITTSSVGIPVQLNLDPEFNGLAKTVIFRAGDVSVDIALVGDATETEVPVDVLTTPGVYLAIGVYAADGNGTIVIPTVWANAGTILRGAVPSGVDPAEPAPSWVAQVQGMASSALEKATAVEESAERGDFDGEDGTDGEDGFSPTINVTDITGGHRLTITDVNGTQTVDVMDGQVGSEAVTSVNGQTGDVVLDAEDVGALPDDTPIPIKTSDLENDSGFLTSAPVTSVNSKTGAVVLGADDVGAATRGDVYGAYPVDTASGAIASFPDGADNIPIKALSVAIEPVQSGSGDPAPDNVRPISGWSEAKVTRTGKNLLTAAPPWGTSAAMVVDLGKDVSVDSVVIQFKANNTSAASTNAALIDLRESDGTHHYSTLNGYRRADGTYFNQQNTPFSGVFSVRHQNIKFRYVYAWYTGSAYSMFDADTITDWQITIADAVSDYEAPAKQAITIDLDGTIYGGTLDVTTGVLTVDKVAVTIDGDTLKADEIASFSPNARTKTNYPTGLTGKYNSTSTFCLSDKLKPNYSQVIGNPANATELCVYPHSSGIFVTFPASTGITTKALANAWFAENTPMVCYELATPQTVQLTPEEASTLLGENNIWADTGDTTVNYRADTTLYIDKLTGSTEEDMIADAPIASGKYFLVGNRLFLSTASIAAGATLTPGTNCTETNLAAALNALNS